MIVLKSTRILSYQSMTEIERRDETSESQMEGQYIGSFAESISAIPRINRYDENGGCDASSCSSSSIKDYEVDTSQTYTSSKLPMSTDQDEQGYFPTHSPSPSCQSLMIVSVNHSSAPLPVVFEEGEEEAEEEEEEEEEKAVDMVTQEEQSCCRDGYITTKISTLYDLPSCSPTRPTQFLRTTTTTSSNNLHELTNTMKKTPLHMNSVNENEYLFKSNNTVCSNTEATLKTSQESFSDIGSIENNLTISSTGKTTKQVQQLEEELENRLNAILALKEVIFSQHTALNASKKDNERIRKKLLRQSNLNKDLSERNMELEKQLEQLQEQLKFANLSTKCDNASTNYDEKDKALKVNRGEIFELLHQINEDRKSERNYRIEV